MDEEVCSSEASVEILVHTSARVTNAEDKVYRKEATAIVKYLNDRAHQASLIKDMAPFTACMQQTPLNSEILVPATKSEVKAIAKPQLPTLAIAESIIVSAEPQASVSFNSLATQADSLPLINTIQSFASGTSSTASILPESVALVPTYKSKQEQQVSRTTGRARNMIWHNADTPTAKITSAESVFTPDSARFKFQSPKGFQTRKRELEIPTEVARPVEAQQILAELSPNKRKKLSSFTDSPSIDTTLSKNVLNVAGSQIQSEGWLGSIAQLTSSSSTVSMPKLIPSPEINVGDAVNAFLAPWPSSGQEQYISHLVGTLALVAGSSRLCAAYRPKEIKRKIEPLERGYWHLRIPFSWSSTDQDGFWGMLQEMIIQGKCGWGNWVEHIATPVAKSRASGEAEEAQVEPVQGHIAEIKVWCWGEVVRELWLSLLMASKRQTLRSGMAWYDCCGNLVIQMR